MRLQYYIAVFLLLLNSGCTPVKTSAFTTLEVTTVGVRPNALIYHVDGEGYGYDLATVKVIGPDGASRSDVVEIALPQTGSVLYEKLVQAVPARGKMWDLLRQPAQRLRMQIRTDDLKHYQQVAGDPSRLLPSVEAIAIESVEPLR